MADHCLDHNKNMSCLSDFSTSLALLQKDIEYLRRDQEIILARFGKHVEEAEKEGGRHERLQKAENAIKTIQDHAKYYMIGSGVLGGLLGSGAAGAIKELLSIWR